MPLEVLSLGLDLDDRLGKLGDLLVQDWKRPYLLPVQEVYQIRPGKVTSPGETQQIPFEEARVFSAQTPDGLYLQCNNGQLSVFFATHEVVVEGDASPLRLLLQLAICELLRQQGLMPIHSSALFLSGGATVLLGKSGTGKTTTLVQAARHGIPALSEDWSWIGTDLTFYPWDQGLHLLPDTVERFDSFLPEQRTWIPRGARHKWRFDPADLGWFQPQACPLSQFWLLKRSPEPSRLDAVPRLDLVRSLWEASGMPLTRPALQLAQQRINQLLTVPAQQLHLGFEVDFSALLNGS